MACISQSLNDVDESLLSDPILSEQLNIFFDNLDLASSPIGTENTFVSILNNILETTGHPALWFYGSTGVILISLAIMSSMKRWPRDKFEWGQTIARLVLGFILASLSFLDIGASYRLVANTNINEFPTPDVTKIWIFAVSGWFLPTLALLLLLEQIVELALFYFAGENVNWKMRLRQVQAVIPKYRPRRKRRMPANVNEKAPESPASDKRMVENEESSPVPEREHPRPPVTTT